MRAAYLIGYLEVWAAPKRTKSLTSRKFGIYEKPDLISTA
jgi:hypothetical protein